MATLFKSPSQSSESGAHRGPPVPPQPPDGLLINLSSQNADLGPDQGDHSWVIPDKGGVVLQGTRHVPGSLASPGPGLGSRGQTGWLRPRATQQEAWGPVPRPLCRWRGDCP